MPRLADVNTTDIADALRLGCETMARVFNVDDGDTPYFGAYARPEARLEFSGMFSDAHVPGRHLNALLSAEDAAGVAIEEEAVEKHARAAFRSFGGPVPLPLNRLVPGGPPVGFTPHNIREGLHALYALARYRASSRARELAEACIAAVVEYWDPEAGWDYGRLEGTHGLECRKGQGFVGGVARATGPLVKYFRATGYGPALDLATRLKDVALSGYFTGDGAYDAELFGTHVHSVTCTLSSLAQLADHTGDDALMARVKAFYDNGLRELRDETGWSVEVNRPDRVPDRGEANNTGDILETALILGRWGHVEYLHDAERILRCHLLPSQLRDISFVANAANPEGVDGRRMVGERLRGAFGFPAPYGHEPVGSPYVAFNLDIVGGAVGSLCEAYRSTTRYDDSGHRVDLLFDSETPAISVESPYTHPALRIRLKRPGPLSVRLPPWADPGSLRVSGYEGPVRHAGGYLTLSGLPVDTPLSLEFEMPVREIALEHRTRRIRTLLRGDEVAAMEDFGADLTFFPPLA